MLRAAEACGKHSLEIFAAGCLAALIGRILYRTFGPVWPLQIAVNLIGLALMRRKGDLPTKVCVQCGRPFTWRKKWERVWDEVKYCSDKCRREAKSAGRSATD